jgi:hypothetical protein
MDDQDYNEPLPEKYLPKYYFEHEKLCASLEVDSFVEFIDVADKDSQKKSDD